MNKVQFLGQEKPHILRFITEILQENKPYMKASPEDYREDDADEPCIDIRLGIDLDDQGDYQWAIMTGDSSYDQCHYAVCAASSFGINAKAAELTDELLDDCLDQDWGGL